MDTSRLLKAIIENAIDGIITIDRRGIVDSINPAASKLFGYDAHEVIGNNVSMLMPEPDHSQHDQYISNYLTTGEKKIIGIGREVRGLRKDGTTFPFRLAVSQVHYEDKIAFTGFVHDLSKEKEAEEKLIQHMEELEASVRNYTKELNKLEL